VTRAQLTDEEWAFIEPYLPIGGFGPYPGRLREQFEGVVWRFRAGAQWREMPERFGAWQTVYQRFARWRDAGVFEALLEGLIAEAARRGEVDMSLVSVDSTTARAHQDAAGMRVDEEVMAAVEEAVREAEETAQKKRAKLTDQAGRARKQTPGEPNAGGDGRPGWARPCWDGPAAV
jgi:transposase